MTIVAVEFDQFTEFSSGETRPILRVVADSRVVRSDTITTELAPKILPLRMLSWNVDGLHRHLGCYGFAYSGSVTAALLTHAIVNHYLGNLFSDESRPGPSVREVADLVAWVGKEQMTEIGVRLPPNERHFATFSAVVVGRDCQSADLKAFYLEASIEPELQVELQDIDASNGVFSFGSGKKLFEQTRHELIETGEAADATRVVVKMIDSKLDRSVGGKIQAGGVDRDLFVTYDIVQNLGPDLADLSYIGLDVEEVTPLAGFKPGKFAIGWDPGPFDVTQEFEFKTKR